MWFSNGTLRNLREYKLSTVLQPVSGSRNLSFSTNKTFQTDMKINEKRNLDILL